MNDVRKIIHVDMDAFFASVEQRDFPEYRGKPVIVGGRPERRGVVAACSYEARKFGIHSAMPSAQAVKLCPQAVFVTPRFEAYRESSQQIHKVFSEYTRIIEPLSLDEAYLDVSESRLFRGSATKIARAIKEEIKQEVNLTASAGVSYNKFLAKIASDMDKPNGLFVITPDQAQDFINGLPIGKFFGIGKVTEAKMHSLGIYTGADLCQFDLVELQTQFGKSGRYYYNICRGIDDRAVQTSRERKSIGKETTFEKDVNDKRIIWQTLSELAEKTITLLQQKKLHARTVTLKVKYHNFKQITRSQTSGAINELEQLLKVLPILLKRTDVGVRPIRLIGLALSGLESENSVKKYNSSSKEVEVKQTNLFDK